MHVKHAVDVKNCRMALCASEVMEGVVAALNRLPLSLVSSEWVEQVELKLNANAMKLKLRFLDLAFIN